MKVYQRRLILAGGAMMCSLFFTGSSHATVVAVIDTGIDTEHPALQGSLWLNTGESGKDSLGRDRSKNGIDDDNNGFIDDVHGWNFVDNSNDISDQHGHGTHVAGLIIGVQPGVSKEGRQAATTHGTSLMIIKYYDSKKSEEVNMKNTVRAIEYATRMGAQIINYSGGGYGRNLQEEAAIRSASAKNILFIAAAGNEQANSDLLGYYPADYNLPNILSVGAVDQVGRLIPCSNYGLKTVHVAARGNKVLSTIPGGGWSRMTGTSQAAALVSYLAADMMNKQPGLRSPAAVIEKLVKEGQHDEALAGKTLYQVRLDPFFLDKI